MIRNVSTSAIAALLFLSGCGGNGSGKALPASSSTPAASTTPASTPATPPAPAPAPAPTGPLTALVAPTVTSDASGTTITWSDAGRGSAGYVIDLDDDDDATDGTWQKTVATGTTSSSAPAGFSPTNNQGPIMLVGGASYTVKVIYTATKESSPSATFTAYRAPIAAGAVPTDDIDLTTVTVKTSPQDIASWPSTAKITSLAINANGNTGWQILFTKRDGPNAWPNVPAFGPGPGSDLEYTLWALVNIGGTWYTSGVIQLWSDPSDQLWSGGAPSQMAMNWWYDPNRWAPMTTHQPVKGEQVGFMVVAGNERNNPPLPDPTQVIVEERSNIVVVPFPADSPGLLVTYP